MTVGGSWINWNNTHKKQLFNVSNWPTKFINAAVTSEIRTPQFRSQCDCLIPCGLGTWSKIRAFFSSWVEVDRSYGKVTDSASRTHLYSNLVGYSGINEECYLQPECELGTGQNHQPSLTQCFVPSLAFGLIQREGRKSSNPYSRCMMELSSTDQVSRHLGFTGFCCKNMSSISMYH